MNDQPIINHTTIETRNGYLIVACFLLIFTISVITVGKAAHSISDRLTTMQTSCLSEK